MEPLTSARRITRARKLRTCTECQKRKLKCDRRLPACTSCQKRDEAAHCFYTKKTSESSLENERQRRLQAEARLEHLENLVKELTRPSEISTSNSSDDVNTTQRARVDIPSEIFYNGATHWSTMLDEIDELRAIVREDDSEISAAGTDPDSDEDSASSILFGATKPLSLQQVLSQFLPPRHKVDRLVGAYFRTKTVTAPFIHSTQFFRLYQLFWDNHNTTSPLWISLLFSILNIATRMIPSGSLCTSTGENKSVDQFDIAAAHCLAIGEYYRPQKFSVEALLLYAHSKCLAGADLGPDVALVCGTLIRLATIMGYHRDADGSRQKLSAFEGEMRRRTWSMCMQLDMLISFQLGLPSNVQFPTWDTKPPTNLLNSDFDEDSVKLPPARPAIEPTELRFYIAKHHLMTVFEKVIRHTLSATDRPNEELEALDKEIRETFAALPVVFQARSMADSVVDSPSVKVTRLCVYFIYQKCLCVLHRKHITRGRQNSLQICHISASDLVRRFLDMYAEFEPGGQLETERWFMSTITWHDFLLGCTAICLTVCYTKYSAADSTSIIIIDVAGSLDLLESAKAVCEGQFSKRRDTKKVRHLIEATILRCSCQDNGNANATNAAFHDGQDEETSWSATAVQADNYWLWPENTTDFTADNGWAFMEHFLDLPNQDLMFDVQY